MKKILSGILCIAMLFSMAISANARIVDSSGGVDSDEPEENGIVDDYGNSYNSTELVYKNNATYEIVIPAEVYRHSTISLLTATDSLQMSLQYSL